MISGFFPADFLLNHLWQSTLFAAAAALLTLLFRKNNARVRYALWLTASIKFIVPFSLFIAIGNSIDISLRQTAAIPEPAINIVENISLPFDTTYISKVPISAMPERNNLVLNIVLIAWLVGCLSVLFFYLARGKRVRKSVRDSEPLTQGRAFEALQQIERINGRRRLIRLAFSSSSMEPGVFGIFRPVLLLPLGMPERLSDAELESILAHELAHVRRRDNLVSAVHMFIETLFWFHPMVWWIGAKLIQERERACDEEVLRLGKDPQAYAEGILKVCEFCLESPLACVAGITGSDMKKRIHAIMTQPIGSRPGFAKKLLLAGAGIMVLTLPFLLGLFIAPQGQAQPQSPKPSFDVVSIKKAADCRDREWPLYQPGGRYKNCGGLKFLIIEAYNMKLYTPLDGVPDWGKKNLYRIEAKAAGHPSEEQMHRMVQSVLEDRFKLEMHSKKRESKVYSLVVAKGGHRLQPAKDEHGNPMTSLPSPEEIRDSMERQRFRKFNSQEEVIAGMPPGSIIAGSKLGESGFIGKAMSMNDFAESLSLQVGNLPVIDRTGLSGLYDIHLKFARPDLIVAGSPAVPEEPSAPGFFRALQEQLGLKLEQGKGLVDHFVIDSVKRPSEN